VIPALGGYYLARAFDYDFKAAVFIGTALTATSIAITANVLREMGKLQTEAAKAIIGAAVIDDILALLALSVSEGIVSGELSAVNLTITIAKAIGFIAIGIMIGQFLLRRLIVRFDKTKIAEKYPQSIFIFAIMVAFLYAMAGNFLNYMIPIRAGEIAKSYFLKKSDDIPYTKSFPSIFVDKIFDTLGIFLVLLLIPFLKLQLSLPVLILMGLLLLVFLAGFFILLLAARAHGKVTSFVQKLFFWLPAKWKGKVNHLISLVIEGTGLFHNHTSLLMPVTGLTGLGIFLDALYFYCIFLAFNVHINFFIVMFGYTLINLSYILPQPPAQLGSNEWMMVIIFAVGFGMIRAQVAAIMAFAHILTALIMTVFGVASLSYAGIHNINFLTTRGEELHDES
jgi:uncharacterized protein (TIRG00374 family)